MAVLLRVKISSEEQMDQEMDAPSRLGYGGWQ